MRRGLAAVVVVALSWGCVPSGSGDGGDGGVQPGPGDGGQLGPVPVGCGLGCGGGGEPSPPSGDASTLDGFFGGIATAVCGKMFECCPDGVEFIPDEAQCVAFFTGLAGGGLVRLAEAGMVRYDPASGVACVTAAVQAINAMACDGAMPLGDPTSGVAACDTALVPLVAEGGACAVRDSDNGTISANAACIGEAACVDGICVALAGLGGACTDSEICGDAGYCDQESQTCAAKKPNGAGCAQDAECSSDTCGEAGECAEGGGLQCGTGGTGRPG